MKQEYECAFCGGKVLRSPSEISKSGKTFCCVSCYRQYSSGSNHHRWSSHIRKCEQCGIEIQVPEYKLKQKRHFCSRTCKISYFIKEHAPKWKGGNVLIDCKVCNVAFELPCKDAKKSKNHYCSRICFNADATNIAVKKEKHARWSGGLHEKACAVCGKLFYNYISTYKMQKGKYCSVECCAKARIKIKDPIERENMLHNKKILRASLEYKIWKSTVINRDGRKCVVCGVKKRLQAHHIVPISQDITLATDPQNGVTLCIDCHLKAHHKKMFA